MDKPVLFNYASALRGQAQVRLWLSSAVIGFGLGAFYIFNAMPEHAIAMGVVHILYALAYYVVASRVGFDLPRWSADFTAAVDALLLTGWVIVLGDLGQLVVPIYIFSSIGYGMRTGSKRIMYVSQIVSVVGLAIAPFFAQYWRDHALFWLSYLISIVIIPGYAAILMDKLYLAVKYAESESQAKSDLLARVSHELRTPLGGISNAAELLQLEATAERPRKLAKTIISLSAHLLSDINELLDQSKLSFGRMKLSSESFVLAEQLDVINAAVEENARKKGLGFTSLIDPRIDQAVVGDRHWLTRVLINLLGNSIKFTDFGSVALNISLLHQSRDGYLIRFSVKDTGIGIPPDFQEKIFEPFVQLKRDVPNQVEGAGLGLAISKQVVELMGGTLKLASDIGMGSSFWFDLCLPCAQGSALGSIIRTSATEASNTYAMNISGRRLLVVDDNETNCYLLRELLMKDGHDVIAVNSGKDALDILSSQEKFDLILLDYNLGDMDGSVVLQTYRFGRRNPVPAYFLTADATALTTEKLRNTGALGILTKPIRAEALRDAIAAACDTDVSTQKSVAKLNALENESQASASSASRLRPIPVVFIDMSVIERLKQIGTRNVFIRELLERADKDIQQSTTRILKAFEVCDLKELRDAAHALKGVCLETGAIRLMSMALGIMRAEDNYLIEQRARLAADLSEASKKTRDALTGIIEETVLQAAGF